MPTRDDIESDFEEDELVLFCKACQGKFARIPLDDVGTINEDGSLQAAAELLIEQHLRTCPLPDPETTPMVTSGGLASGVKDNEGFGPAKILFTGCRATSTRSTSCPI